MNDPKSESGEVHRLCRMLRQTAEMAREVSMTGSMEQGARRAALQFNLAVRRLEELGAVPPDLFPRLSEEANLDETGVASLQLAGYLDDSPSAAEAAAPEGPLFGTLAVSHLGSLEDLELLRRLRRTLRERDPDLLQDLGAEAAEAEEAHRPERPHA